MRPLQRDLRSIKYTPENPFVFLSMPNRVIIYIPRKVLNKFPFYITGGGGEGPIIACGGGGDAFSWAIVTR